MAAGKKQNSGTIGSRKGIVLATIAGVLMSFFYRFVASAMDLNNFISPTPGMATPYTAFSSLLSESFSVILYSILW